HLATLATRKQDPNRRATKMALARQLYGRGWNRGDVIKLFRFLDWVLALPKHLEKAFFQEFLAFEQEKHMPYISTVERMIIEEAAKKAAKEAAKAAKAEAKEAIKEAVKEARAEALKESLLEMITEALRTRFPSEAAGWLALLQTQTDLAV